MRRWSIVVVVAAALGVAGILVVVLSAGSGAQTDGLSRQKIAELAELGVTPQRYMLARKRGEEHEAALRTSPPADPNIVGPRLIREERESELLAWKQLYGKRLGTKVDGEWHVHQLRGPNKR